MTAQQRRSTHYSVSAWQQQQLQAGARSARRSAHEAVCRSHLQGNMASLFE